MRGSNYPRGVVCKIKISVIWAALPNRCSGWASVLGALYRHKHWKLLKSLANITSLVCTDTQHPCLLLDNIGEKITRIKKSSLSAAANQELKRCGDALRSRCSCYSYSLRKDTQSFLFYCNFYNFYFKYDSLQLGKALLKKEFFLVFCK